MKNLILLLLTTGIFFSLNSHAANLGESCVADTDCGMYFCDSQTHTCTDCCQYNDQMFCPAACNWDYWTAQCHNSNGLECESKDDAS